MNRGEKVVLIILIVLVLLIIGVALAYSEALDLQSYVDLQKMTLSEQNAFFSGFMLGSYAAGLLANRLYQLPVSSALSLMIFDRTPDQLREEVLRWYLTTGNFTIPLYVAVYRRNLP